MATSAITNTILDLSGTAVSDVVIVARLKPGPGFRIAGTSEEVASQITTTSAAAGTWSLTLERQANITPLGSYYEIEEQIPDSKGGLKSWTITVGDVGQTLFAALVNTLPADVGPTYLTQTTGDARYAQLGNLGSTSTTAVATSAVTGTAGSASRSDHVHNLAGFVVATAAINTSAVTTAKIADSAVTKAKIDTEQQLPAGAVSPYAGSTAPTGWLDCDGAAVSRTTYATLFTVVSTTYGVGDGATTFNVPDLKGRVPVGKEASQTRLTSAACGITSTTLGNAGGSQLTESHNHSQNAHSHADSQAVPSYICNSYSAGTNVFLQVGKYEQSGGSTTATNNSFGSGTAGNVQPSIVLNYIIKT